jgi:hypothetical protein
MDRRKLWLGIALFVAASSAHAQAPMCGKKLINDDLLVKPSKTTKSDHQVIVRNDDAWPAFIRVVSKTRANATWMFWVDKGTTSTIANIPDGSYAIRYALGGQLAADCRTVVDPVRVGEFPRVPEFRTTLTPSAEGTLVETTTASFTISSVDSGKGEAHYIPVGDFNSGTR